MPESRRRTALVCEEVPSGSGECVRSIGDDGWQSVLVHDFDRAGWLASVRNFGLIILAGQSVEWCRDALRAIRPQTMSPILGLTPDLDEAQASLLQLGADMVLVEDASGDLLHSAIHALMRRAPDNEPRLRYLKSDGLWVDLWGRQAVLAGSPVSLTPIEFDLLRILMTHPQTPVRHLDIIREVWNWKYTDERNALRLHINRLRGKLVGPSGPSSYIASVRGVGYVFVPAVLEFADDLQNASDGQEYDRTNPFLERRMRPLISGLIGAGSREQACELLVQTVVAEGMSDSVAVLAHRPGSNMLNLVAQVGMSAEWLRVVSAGVPLSGRFLASDTFTQQRTRSYVDLSRLKKRYDATVRLLQPAELLAQLSVPLIDRNGVWGQLGYCRRVDSPFTMSECVVLEVVGAMLGALFADGPHAVVAAS
jgi:DNA-binding response OmpR family regulator